jgi:hypothetical protein
VGLRSVLSVVVAEEVVVFAVGAVDALQAADQKYGYACRHQRGEKVFTRRKAM